MYNNVQRSKQRISKKDYKSRKKVQNHSQVTNIASKTKFLALVLIDSYVKFANIVFFSFKSFKISFRRDNFRIIFDKIFNLIN